MHPYVPVDHVWPHRISLLNPGLSYYIARIGMVLVASGWNLPATHCACIAQVAMRQNRVLCIPYCVAYLDSSDSKASSVRFSCPLERIDLVSSDPFRSAMTRISFNISLVHTDDIGKNVDLLGPQILQIGVLKPEPLISLLERSVTAARHRLNVDMSKSPVFLDLGPLLWSEQEVKSTTTCSDIEKRGEAKVSASQDTALLWCSFFCLDLH